MVLLIRTGELIPDDSFRNYEMSDETKEMIKAREKERLGKYRPQIEEISRIMEERLAVLPKLAVKV